MKLHDKIIHTFQVAHSLHCNDQARVNIEKLCKIAENTSELKWNELNFWLRNNPLATVEEIQVVREMLNQGKSVRGYKTEARA